MSKEMDSVQDWSICKSRRIITFDSYSNNNGLENLIDNGFHGFFGVPAPSMTRERDGVTTGAEGLIIFN